jgi:hypothetical protein
MTLPEGAKVKSVWQRPLKGSFWASVFLIILVSVVLVVFYPLLVATIKWNGHPSVDYQGMTLKLPFGWIYSPSGLPLTIQKPWPSSLTGVQSSLFIQKTGVKDANREALRDSWAKMHASGSWITINVPPLMPSNENGTALRCSRQLPRRLWGTAFSECLSSDAEWSFRFLGQQSDMEQAEGIMRNVPVRAAVPQ